MNSDFCGPASTPVNHPSVAIGESGGGSSVVFMPGGIGNRIGGSRTSGGAIGGGGEPIRQVVQT